MHTEQARHQLVEENTIKEEGKLLVNTAEALAANAFIKYLESLKDSIDNTLNPDKENSTVGFALIVFNKESENTTQAHLLSNTGGTLVYRILKSYVEHVELNARKAKRRLFKRKK